MTPKKWVKLENDNLYLWWTDDEVQILLECVNIIETRKKYDEGIDWESKKEQDDNVKKNISVSRFPNEETQDFPHDTTEFTKDRTASKAKQIWIKYKNAIDAG